MASYSRQSKFTKTIFSVLFGLRTDKTELEQLKHVFNEIDLDKNGEISKKEFLAADEKLKKYGLTGNWNEILRGVDTDGNGSISYEEFYTAAVDKTKILTDESIEAAFKLFDLDNDGTIEIKEFMACLPSEAAGRSAHKGKGISQQIFERDNSKWVELL